MKHLIEANQESIKSCFDYYHITAECVAIFGDWAVSNDKDIVNINRKCSNYPIYSNNPMQASRTSILEHLQGKVWFDEVQRDNLIQALDYIGLQ